LNFCKQASAANVRIDNFCFRAVFVWLYIDDVVSSQPQQRKMIEDADKRLNVLFDRLNNAEVGQGAVDQLVSLAKGNSQI
jgi:hypothetical protein